MRASRYQVSTQYIHPVGPASVWHALFWSPCLPKPVCVMGLSDGERRDAWFESKCVRPSAVPARSSTNPSRLSQHHCGFFPYAAKPTCRSLNCVMEVGGNRVLWEISWLGIDAWVAVPAAHAAPNGKYDALNKVPS